MAIQFLTDYYTAPEKGPVKEIAKATKTGPATTILAGIGSGYESTVMSIIIIALSILASAIIWHGGQPTRLPTWHSSTSSTASLSAVSAS